MALADLDLRISQNLPLALLEKWLSSRRDQSAHETLLEPFRRDGVVVSTDASGLSKLSATKNLLEVMELVHVPKDRIFQYGRSIGGIGVGVWAADNTQMFYDHQIDADQIVEAMVAVQKDLATNPLKTGMAIHSGTFWEISGGLYGQEADLNEKIAEDLVSGGELVLTDKFYGQLSRAWQKRFTAKNLDEVGQAVYSIENVPQLDGVNLQPYELKNELYPIPFHPDFYHYLQQAQGNHDFDNEIVKKFLQHRIVVLIKIYHPHNRLLLDQFSEWILADQIVRKLANKHQLEVIKSNGDLAILTAEKFEQAVETAEEIFRALDAVDYNFSIGMAKDDLLVFDLERGGKDLAGNPVNIASKIAEDIPEMKTLYIHDSVQHPRLNQENLYTDFSMVKSGVSLSGKRFLLGN